MRSLYQSLEAGAIIYDLPGRDRDAVLRALVEAMPLPPDADHERLYAMLREREEMASTGIGEGIAVPHVRNPVILDVPEPIVTLAFLSEPVDFGALDGRPVDTLFSLVSPSTRGHLHLLSRLVFALKDDGFRRVLAGRAVRDKILFEAARVEGAFLPSPAFPRI